MRLLLLLRRADERRDIAAARREEDGSVVSEVAIVHKGIGIFLFPCVRCFALIPKFVITASFLTAAPTPAPFGQIKVPTSYDGAKQ